MRNPVICIIILLFCSLTQGGQLTAGVAQMPMYAESADEGVLINFIKALSEESGNEIRIRLLPFSRSMQFVKNREVDFHVPLIEAPYSTGRELDYDYSTATIFHVNFVLYDNKNNPVDLSELDQYIIETDTVHKEYFDFKIHPSACLACSIKKVAAGRLDGLIYADMAIDPLIKRYNLANIQRRLYKTFEVKMVLPKGSRGGELDLMLSNTIDQLRHKGKLQRVLNSIDQPFDDWQP